MTTRSQAWNHVKSHLLGIDPDSKDDPLKLSLEQEGIDSIFGTPCKLDTDATDNINSLSAMVKDGYDIFMNTSRANSFFVTNKEGKMWRFGHLDGLYTLMDEDRATTYALYQQANGQPHWSGQSAQRVDGYRFLSCRRE